MRTKGASALPLQSREDAKAIPAHARPAAAPARTDADLLHELRVHQIELEMQNEELRRAQVDLEESRDRYVDLFEFAPVGYLTLSRTGQIATINLTGAMLLGEDRTKLLQRRFAHFVVTADQDRWLEYFLGSFKTDGTHVCELSLQRLDGTVFRARLDCRGVACDDTATTLRISVTDVTERWEAVKQQRVATERIKSLALEQARHLRKLARELTHAEQEERDRLYELLHNEIQPLLVATRLSLSGISASAPTQDAMQIARHACTHIGQVIRMVRTLGLQLNPPLIRDRGLSPALESLCQWMKVHLGLTVDLTRAQEAEPADMAMRLLCFNAVRELLMNVAKHANTAHAILEVQRGDRDSLRISVVDRGCGFDPTVNKIGSGLAWIERRLGMFGGCLLIDSHPGQGTVATLTMPLQPAAATDECRKTGESDA